MLRQEKLDKESEEVLKKMLESVSSSGFDLDKALLEAGPEPYGFCSLCSQGCAQGCRSGSCHSGCYSGCSTSSA